MQLYTGIKDLLATPMTRGEYNLYRGWNPPPDEYQSVEGYLVEYQDGSDSNDIRHMGYISWSPKEVFEKAYRPGTGMSFSLALHRLKQGDRIARQGWNGKGMFLWLNEGSYSGPGNDFLIDGIPGRLFNKGDTGTNTRLPNINMRSASGSIVTGWLASQADMLAEDWEVV